jgi:hypothetical protein
MQTCFFGRGLAFRHLFDEVDATSGTIELITQQLVSGACSGTEATVHAFTKNSGGLNTLGSIDELGGELSLHKGVKKDT